MRRIFEYIICSFDTGTIFSNSAGNSVGNFIYKHVLLKVIKCISFISFIIFRKIQIRDKLKEKNSVSEQDPRTIIPQLWLLFFLSFTFVNHLFFIWLMLNYTAMIMALILIHHSSVQCPCPWWDPNPFWIITSGSQSAWRCWLSFCWQLILAWESIVSYC